MTDPVFALEPDIPRNVRIARWLLFRLLSGIRGGSLTLRVRVRRRSISARHPLRCMLTFRS